MTYVYTWILSPYTESDRALRKYLRMGSDGVFNSEVDLNNDHDAFAKFQISNVWNKTPPE